MKNTIPFRAGLRACLVTLISFGLAAGCSSKEPSPSPISGGASLGGEAARLANGEPDERSNAERSCRSDAECISGETPVCDPVEGCVECLFDWDCPALHRCDERSCEEITACEKSDQCGDSEFPVCDEVLEQCVQCREDTHCADGERCAGGECEPNLACVNSRDCEGGLVCDAAAGVCVTCVVDGDCGEGSACVDNACVPTCDSDKECLGLGLLCDLGTGRCSECLGNQDCPDLYHCVEGGVCELDVCEQGQSACDGAKLAVCNGAGSGFDLSTCGAGTDCQEEGMQAACVAYDCTPSAVECSADATAVITCAADGFSSEVTTLCQAGEACHDAACLPTICEPGSFTCDYDGVQKCNASGTAMALHESCSYFDYCDADAGECVPRTCDYPGSKVCDGNVVKTCDDNAERFLEGGVDCSDTDEACYQGACQPVVCEGEYTCQGADLFECRNNGTLISHSLDCQAEALCNAGAGRCDAPVCIPGAFVCDGDVATRCKPDGSGFVEGGTDCAASNMVCDGGGCLPEICEAGTYYCSGGNPQQCSTKGTTTTQRDTCYSYEYCREGSSYCLRDVCTAGAPICDGNTATTCESDGSGPAASGTDCGDTGEVCEDGECKASVCTPGEEICTGEAVYKCRPTGTGYDLNQACTGSRNCQEDGDTASCVANICSPEAIGCDGEVIATCAENGGSWESQGTNCALTGQICAGASCGAEEITTQGSYVSYYNRARTGETALISFDVLYARRLSEIEAYAEVPGVQKLTWVVYEKREASSTLDLVFQKVTAQGTSGVAWLSSGELDFEFQAGKSYAVGLHNDGSIRRYYYNSSPVPTAAFARNFSAKVGSASSQPAASVSSWSSSYKYYMRFKTELAD